MPEYASADGRFGCVLNAGVVEKIEELHFAAWPRETGGILVGFYNPARNSAIITSAEPAPPDSSCHRFNFVRGIRGLTRKLRALWNQKGGPCSYYLGEWHTHPDGPPEPSAQDRRQMGELARDSKVRCPEALLIIAGGSRGEVVYGVFVFTRDGEEIGLSPVD